ncbi:MAG: Holliday junction resolvase RuvX [Alphaproteobacteria bacterium]|nr:Holliday junction resolvase RuvX [Alphaproteobacteria bacterium]
MAIVAIKELKTALPAKTRLLGIDHGSKTWGLALADPGLTIATPLKTIRRTKFTENLRELAALCKEYEVGGFIIGLPLNMDDSEGPRAQSVRHFGFNLLKEKEQLGFEPVIAFFDERLSTHAAEQLLIDDLDMKRGKRKEIIDAMAAAHILQGALDALNRPAPASENGENE